MKGIAAALLRRDRCAVLRTGHRHAQRGAYRQRSRFRPAVSGDASWMSRERRGWTCSSCPATNRRRRYIIEANGTGVAFLDYDGDGRQDLFLVNGSKLDGFGDAAAPTNHLYRNQGERQVPGCDARSGNGALGVGQRRVRRRRHE